MRNPLAGNIARNARRALVLIGLVAAGPVSASEEDAHAFLGGIAYRVEAAPRAALDHIDMMRFGPAGLAYVMRPAPSAAVGSPEVDSIQTGAIRAGVFDSVAIPMRNFPALERWRPIAASLDRCMPDAGCGKGVEWFADMVERARDLPLRARMAFVSETVNGRIRYVRDTQARGLADHWASPEETLAFGTGDCEDFAILKMAALARAGVPAGSMSLVVLRDSALDVYHAVLTVRTSQGSFVLDNLRDTVLTDDKLPTYQPLFSLSGDRAWIHGSRRGGAEMASRLNPMAIASGEGLASDAVRPR